MIVAWYAKNSGALSGNLVTRVAAIKEKRSSHCEISVIGSLPGGGSFPGPIAGSGSIVTSAISRNSRSRIFLTVFIGRDAAGLNGPGPARRGGLTGLWCAEPAAAASIPSPFAPALGVKIGSVGSVPVDAVSVWYRQ